MLKEDKVAAEIHVSGRVQGVGYRYFTEKAAATLGIKGWSMNLQDGRVMLYIEADRSAFDMFIRELNEGPHMSDVTDVSVKYRPYEGRYQSFSIRF
jgi:acylphosphatase